jgi:hypothetical protein
MSYPLVSCSDYNLQGRSPADVSRSGRAELLEAARRWTAEYRDLPDAAVGPNTEIILCGHQPTMFHPGVWLKNAVLGNIARRRGAAAVNLIIDGDVCMTAALPAPTGSAAEPRVETIAYDLPEPNIPHEERRIEDRVTFGRFGRRTAAAIAPLIAHPAIERYWPLVLRRAEATDKLGYCLAQARHLLETEFWGRDHRTLEVPFSRLCRGEAFQWFVAHLVAQLPRLLPIYNDALREYRRLNRIRGRSHPAPELAAEPPWLEAPFWVWTADNPRRRRLFAQLSGNELILADREDWQCRLPLRSEGPADRAVERLFDLQNNRGVRIRPKALMTTLWARLFLGDLFIHGTGGAKYDWVTDRIIERFFRLPPPPIRVITADVPLNVQFAGLETDNPRKIDIELREMSFHPERYLEEAGGAAELIAEKRRLLAQPKTAENARRRDAELRRLNVALQGFLIPRREELLLRREKAARRSAAEAILSRRDYAFCLHAESTLRDLPRLCPADNGGKHAGHGGED